MTQSEFNKRLDAAALAAGPATVGWNWRYRQGLKDQGLKIIPASSTTIPLPWAAPPFPFPGDDGKDSWEMTSFIVPA